MKLCDRNWKPFYLSELFEIESCKCNKVSELAKGDFPYIGATNRNNGLLNFVSPIESLITKGNCIVFICDGDGSIGYNIYKKEDFIGSTTLKVGRNKCLNKYIGLFITTVADRARKIYDFGYKRNEVHLRNERLYLPFNQHGQPDYEFMEAYMRKKEEKFKKQYKEFIVSRLDKYYKKPETPRQWKEFEINELFSIYTGTDLILGKIKAGKIPVVSHAIVDNGVTQYSSVIKSRKIFNSNTSLSLADRGNFKAFTQLKDFYIGTRVKALEIKQNIPSKYTLLFISQAIDKQSDKFSYGNNACNRLPNLKIILPITSSGQPDYEYMEDYMKYLEQRKLQDYIKYIEKKD